jgi:hypothetical protein
MSHQGFYRDSCPNVSGSLDRFRRRGRRLLTPMSTNYFGEGLRTKLAELQLKYEAFAKEAGISEKTVRRAIKGEEVDERSKQSVIGALGTTTEALISLGRSRILGRIWFPPEQKEREIYELTEVLDAHHLFRALTGKIQGYGITLPQLQTETIEGISVLGTDFEQLAKLQEFLISLMLIAPVDPLTTSRSDPSDWDKRLKDLGANKYVLFIGVDRARSRIVQFVQADDLSIASQTERPRTYIWDLRDPLQDD